MRKIKMSVAGLVTSGMAFFGCAGVAHATMSGCHAQLLSSYAGAYAYCTSGSGGSVRVLVYCYSPIYGTTGYYGPKVYSVNQTSTQLCPHDHPTANGATFVLGS